MKSIGRLWPQYLPVPKNGESNEPPLRIMMRSEEHTSELQSQSNLVCRLLLEKKKRHPLVLRKLLGGLERDVHGLRVTHDGDVTARTLHVGPTDVDDVLAVPDLSLHFVAHLFF